MADTPPAPLYLLPGLICDETVWAECVDRLSDYQPVAMPGFGQLRSIGVMAEHVLAVTPERISLAGHSMGARVALEIVRRAPERVERLALLSTGVHPLAQGETEKRMALYELGVGEGMTALVDSWLPPMVHAERRDDAAFMRPLREMCLRAGIEQFEAQMVALLERPDARPLLATIRCPTMVAVGSDDVWSPPDQNRQIAAGIRDADFVLFEHSGHMAPFETPALVSESLRTWLHRAASNEADTKPLEYSAQVS